MRIINRHIKKFINLCLITMLMINLISFYNNALIVFAKGNDIEVAGTKYGFDEKNDYVFEDAISVESSSKTETYGKFYISGNVESSDMHNNYLSYAIDEGLFTISYDYDDKLLNANEDELHLSSDDGKKINGKRINSKIQKGTIIIQTSKDGDIWCDASLMSDIFEKTPINKEPIYESTDIQLINGTYYRVIVVYELKQRTKDNKYWVDEYKTNKYAEVYEFYAYNRNAASVTPPAKDNRFSLGEKKRADKYEGYSQPVPIKDDGDPHYGWEIGEFFVGGYTEMKGTNTFIKETGDRVSLWFNLKQDINNCNNKDGIYVVSDENGYDQELETERTYFGKGALIIKKTNSDGTKEKPVIYTNFLEASASPDADIKVSLFEEGDYQVTLDYELKYDKTKIPLVDFSVFPEKARYKISFSFSIRNGNTIVFFKDVGNNDSELTTGSCTENEIKVDYAKSKYLKVYYERSTLNGNVFDVRKNTVVSDGDVFKDEGVYKFTITNETTGQTTEKILCIGNEELLQKYYQFLANGYVNDDNNTPEEAPVNIPEKSESDTTKPQVTNINIYITIIPIVIVLASIGFFVKNRNKKIIEKGNKENEESDNTIS